MNLNNNIMKPKFNIGDMVHFQDRVLSQSGEISEVYKVGGIYYYKIKCMGVSYTKKENQIKMI